MKSIILALLFLCAVCGSSSEITPTADIPPTLVIEFWKATAIQKDAKIDLMKAQQDYKEATADKIEAMQNIVAFCETQGKALAETKDGDMSCGNPPKEEAPSPNESMPWIHPQQLPISTHPHASVL